MRALKFILCFIFDWVWQLPQNLIGLCYYLMIRKEITKSIKPNNDTYTIYYKESVGGISLGKFIFVPINSHNLDFITKHETGHNKQSKMLGPLYLLVIGIPSFMWASLHRDICPNKDYYWFYPESWANKLAGIKREV